MHLDERTLSKMSPRLKRGPFRHSEPSVSAASTWVVGCSGEELTSGIGRLFTWQKCVLMDGMWSTRVGQPGERR